MALVWAPRLGRALRLGRTPRPLPTPRPPTRGLGAAPPSPPPPGPNALAVRNRLGGEEEGCEDDGDPRTLGDGAGTVGSRRRAGARLEGFEVVQKTPRGTRRLLAGPGCEVLLSSWSPLKVDYAAASNQPGAVEAATERLRGVASQTFLPAGYPQSVGPGYLPFTVWLFGQNCLASANGVMATSFLLYGAGLGAGAIPTAGALNWVLKDGLGQMGALLFGRAIAPRFDMQPKAWYLVAQMKLNAAMALEIATVAAASLGPWSFLALGSLANGLKGLSWMAGGSTRSAFNVSFALRDNIGDITAKATSQAICASMVGSAGGMLMLHPLGQDVGAAAGVFSMLAAGHVYCAYRSVRAIPLATINPSRIYILVEAFLEQGGAGADHAAEGWGTEEGWGAEGEAAGGAGRGGASSDFDDADVDAPRLPTPVEVAEVDPVITLGVGDPTIVIGGDLLRISKGRAAPLRAAVEALRGENYLILPGSGGKCHVAFRDSAGGPDLLQGYLHARLARDILAVASSYVVGSEGFGGGGQQGGRGAGAGWDEDEEARLGRALGSTLSDARAAVAGFSGALRLAGWDVHKVILEDQRRRATW